MILIRFIDKDMFFFNTNMSKVILLVILKVFTPR